MRLRHTVRVVLAVLAGCDVRQARTVQDKIERLRLFPLDVAVTGYDRAACGLHNVAHNRIADRRDVVAAAYTVVTAVCANAGADIKGIALLTVVFAVFSVRGAAMSTGERPVARHDNAQMSVTGQFQLAKITQGNTYRCGGGCFCLAASP